MSESQKKMAKRIVEILNEIGYLNFQHLQGVASLSLVIRDANFNQEKARQSCKEKLIHLFTEAIAMYQSEQIEEQMKKLRENNPKGIPIKRCERCQK